MAFRQWWNNLFNAARRRLPSADVFCGQPKSVTWSRSSRAVGGRWEHRAEQYLKQQGLTLVERNFQCRGGEIDLIMREGAVWVFVEVRYRHAASRVSAAESVGPAKRRRLWRTAQVYLQQQRLTEVSSRFDLVAIDAATTAERARQLQWVKNMMPSGY